MAHSLRGPLRRPLFPPIRFNGFSGQPRARPFHSTHSIKAGASIHRPRQPAQPSMRLMAKEQGQMPNDLGLMPDTFIPPTGSKRPPLSFPRALLRLEWAALKRRFLNLFSVIVYKYHGPKPRPAMQFRSVAPAAIGLHHGMYAAFADGDVDMLKRICASGLFEQYEARIRARGKERWEWELVKYNGRAKVVSHKAATLGIEGMGLRQAVVRIASVQRLTRWRGGKVVEGSGGEKDVVEYVVTQRIMKDGKEGDWTVWGTTEETTLEKLDELEEKKRKEME